MDPRSHIRTRLSFLGNFVFRTLRYLIFRARRVAPVQPCFSADKLNRPFYFGPRYILTAPRSRRSSPAFFPFPLPRPLHSRRDITAPYMSRVSLSLFLSSSDRCRTNSPQSILSALITPNSIFYHRRGRVHGRSHPVLVAFQRIEHQFIRAT